MTLRLTPASKAGIPPSTLALQAQGPGSFSGSGGNLSLDGIWKVTAVIARQGGGVEVPLVLSTVVPPQQVDVIESPGAPTIYTLHFDAGRTVQMYLDPGRAGQNDVLATLFDAAGAELPITKATMAAGPVGAAPPLFAQGPGFCLVLRHQQLNRPLLRDLVVRFALFVGRLQVLVGDRHVFGERFR